MDNPERTTWLYWKRVWKSRIKASFYSPWKAVPSVLVAIAQFAYSGRTLKDMAVTLVIIAFVWTVCYFAELFFSAVVLTPPKMHFELEDETSRLRAAVNPVVTPAEARNRALVESVLKQYKYSREQKLVLRFIMDRGNTTEPDLNAYSSKHSAVCGFNPMDAHHVVNNIGRELISKFGILQVTIKPDLRSALAYVLNSEGL